MATYFYRDGTPYVTEFALPVNHRGECTTPKGRVYTRERLAELNDKAFTRANHKRESSMSTVALKDCETHFALFCQTHASLLEDLETYQLQHSSLRTYQWAIEQGLELSHREVLHARSLIQQIKQRSIKRDR